MYEEEVSRLQRIIDDSGNIVFFGGAGVSTESNIPDFRSADGLYLQKYKYSPEQIVSHSFFVSRTEDFYEGFPSFYGKESIRVKNQDGVEKEVFVYMMNAPHKDCLLYTSRCV